VTKAWNSSQNETTGQEKYQGNVEKWQSKLLYQQMKTGESVMDQDRIEQLEKLGFEWTLQQKHYNQSSVSKHWRKNDRGEKKNTFRKSIKAGPNWCISRK
jgi:hypothetical protein